ncbi:aminotransferase class I/II-fold pyridoxal phosphate-dependent enzyme [Aeromicrobium sp.]|uniref:aminotransferase class I/II-fold pyridoxal phosphate-dependent enzyme n=1 Tax=Aeromicrobium sp. TaxID=1871063 RepID=UPI0030C07EAE
MIQTIADYTSDYSARGIAEGISRAIRDGALPAGSQLPPIRRLATEFHCSPTTVSAAWTILTRAGLIHSNRRLGTTVIPQSPSGRGRYRRALERTTTLSIDLSTGVPDPALLPDLAASLSRVGVCQAAATYVTEPVLPELGEHLRSTWAFPADTITVVDGAMDALDLIVTTHLQFGDRVVVENPSFPPLLDLLDAAGVRIVPVDLDDEGIRPEALSAALRSEPRAVFLQPCAQNPTGASFTKRRADELAGVMEGHDAFVVENDSTGMIAASSLHSIGARLPGRCLHVRSFSKSHGPDLRLAAVGGAAALVEPIVNRRFLGQSWTSHLLQRVLLDLLTHDESVAQIDRAAREYARRRVALIRALAHHDVVVRGGDGLNIWLPVVDEAAALIALSGRGIGVAPGRPFWVGADPAHHVRVTSGLIAEDTAMIGAALAAAASS